MSATRAAARRALGAALVTALVIPLAACSSSGSGGHARQARQAIDPSVVVRWPRYWATTDQAETGAQGASNAEFFIGVDGDRLIYNAEDVVRVIDRRSGKQLHQTLTRHGEVICGFQPTARIDDHLVVLATGPAGAEGDQDCQTIRGYDVAEGRFVWARKLAEPARITLGVRRGVVVVSDEMQDPKDFQLSYHLSALDQSTGDVLWTKPAETVWYDDEDRASINDCVVQGTVAARASVVVAVSLCGYFGDDSNDTAGKVPRVAGLDLRTGKRIWLKDANWMHVTQDDLGAVSNGEVGPHPADGAFVPATAETDAAYLDPRTGRATPVATPKITLYKGSKDNSFEACDDFDATISTISTCALVADRDLVFVSRPSSDDKGSALRIDGVRTSSGKAAWRVDLHKRPAKKDEYQSDFEVLGLNTSHTELWIATDDEHVTRYSTSTGAIVGHGLLAPPLGLTKSASAGPGYLAVRTQGGITNPDQSGVTSGLDYYRTSAQ